MEYSKRVKKKGVRLFNAYIKQNDMKYIERSLSILRGEISSNNDSYNHALEEIINRRNELKPLFNECIEKGISMQDLCPELNNEWNEIVLLIAKSDFK